MSFTVLNCSAEIKSELSCIWWVIKWFSPRTTTTTTTITTPRPTTPSPPRYWPRRESDCYSAAQLDVFNFNDPKVIDYLFGPYRGRKSFSKRDVCFLAAEKPPLSGYVLLKRDPIFNTTTISYFVGFCLLVLFVYVWYRKAMQLKRLRSGTTRTSTSTTVARPEIVQPTHVRLDDDNQDNPPSYEAVMAQEESPPSYSMAVRDNSA